MGNFEKNAEILKTAGKLIENGNCDASLCARIASLQKGAVSLLIGEGAEYKRNGNVLTVMADGKPYPVNVQYLQQYLGKEKADEVLAKNGRKKIPIDGENNYENIADFEKRVSAMEKDLYLSFAENNKDGAGIYNVAAQRKALLNEKHVLEKKAEELENVKQKLENEVLSLKKEVTAAQDNALRIEKEKANEISVLNDRLSDEQNNRIRTEKEKDKAIAALEDELARERENKVKIENEKNIEIALLKEQCECLEAEADRLRMFLIGTSCDSEELEGLRYEAHENSDVLAEKETLVPDFAEDVQAPKSAPVENKTVTEDETVPDKIETAPDEAKTEPVEEHSDITESDTVENDVSQEGEEEKEDEINPMLLFPNDNDIYALDKKSILFTYNQLTLMNKEEEPYGYAEMIVVPLSAKTKYPKLLVWAVDSEQNVSTRVIEEEKAKHIIDLGICKLELKGVIKGKEFKTYIELVDAGDNKMTVNTQNNGTVFGGHLYLDAEPYHIHICPISFQNNEDNSADFIYCVEKDGNIIASGDNSEGTVMIENGRAILAKWDENILYGAVQQ